MNNTKTPISILQESLMKYSSSLPVYTEISSTVTPGESKFTIQCTWNNYNVKGLGVTKKEAKQNAAREMLELLSSEGVISIPRSVIENKKIIEEYPNTECNLQSSMNSTKSSASSQELFVNYVGSLMEFCVAHKLPVPCFDNVSSSGQPHNSTFSMNCTVGSLCKEGSGNTKKVAKQNAAKEVLQNLRDNSADMDELVVQYKNLKLMEPAPNDENEIKNTYKKIRNLSAISNDDLLVKDYHLALTNKCKNILEMHKHDLKIAHIMKTCYKENISVTKSMIKKIFNVHTETFKIRSMKYMQCIVGIKLSTIPPMCQIGVSTTFEQAEQAALHNLLEYIILFME